MSDSWQRYQCEYRHHGQTWGVEICATSHADAQARLRSLGMNGEVRGRIALKVPLGRRWWLWPGLAFAAIALVGWLR